MKNIIKVCFVYILHQTKSEVILTGVLTRQIKNGSETVPTDCQSRIVQKQCRVNACG